MQKEIIISVNQEETKVALLENSHLAELFIERKATERLVGNIYKGVVKDILPGMEAAFVDIGMDKKAFLYISDVVIDHEIYSQLLASSEDEVDMAEKLPPISWAKEDISAILQSNQEVLIQVIKEPIKSKGAKITSHITLPGRYLVLTPTVDHIGVSRRITDEKERERLKQIAAKLLPKGMGFIIRTLGEGKSEDEFKKDADALFNLWDRVKKRAESSPPLTLIYQDLSLIQKVLRDLVDEEIDRILCDNEAAYTQILDSIDPSLKPKSHLYVEEEPLFESLGIEKEIKAALKRKVWLKCGGYLIIDQTEAMVAIDVNTGKYVGSDNLENTALKTNLESASEIARQIRLRNLAGTIIVDFIDMKNIRNQELVVSTLKEELARDRVRNDVISFIETGLVKITRKRSHESLDDILNQYCPVCGGEGRVLSIESIIIRAIRKLERITRHIKGGKVMITAHPEVVRQIKDDEYLFRIGKGLGVEIQFSADENLSWESLLFSTFPE